MISRGIILLTVVAVCLSGTRTVAAEKTLQADLLIVGGGESGCAAAVQAARMGVKRIVLVNDIDWLGGQFSAESVVAIDENTHTTGIRHEQPVPRHGLFKEVITRIERRNKQRYGVARPGNTRVITTCRPADAAAAFESLLKSYVKTGQLRMIRHAWPVAAKVEGKALEAVRFRSTKAGKTEFTVRAKLTIDASDWGDVIKLAGAEYEFGPDLERKYGEPEAPTSRPTYPLTDINPITYCMVLVETDKYEPIPKPAHYDARNYRTHRWPKDPLWLYASRRVVDHYHFRQIKHPDVVLICFPAIDYPLDWLPQRVVKALEADERGASKKNIVQMTRRQRQIIFDDAKQYSLGFLHYLQTEVHEGMKDKTHSFRRFRLTREFGTPDRMPPKPYVRESLRLKAMHMMRQQDMLGWRKNSRYYANVMYPDAIAVWQFEFDFHPTKREFLDNGDPAGPWRGGFRPLRNWGPPYSGRATFPLRSLIPAKVDGLLGAQHNLGFSSIVSSAVRLHDQSMAVGQGAGAVAAVALKNGVPPRKIPFDRSLLTQVQSGLCLRHGGGEPAMLWPFRDVPPDHPAFAAINLLAVRRCLPLGPTDVNFQPDKPADKTWKHQVVELSLKTKLAGKRKPAIPTGKLTRAEFASRWWEAIRKLPDRPFPRKSPTNADVDGVPDASDPLPFTPGTSSWPSAKLPIDRDGLPEALLQKFRVLKQFNFTGRKSPAVTGFINDNGEMFDAERGYGWDRDLTANHLRRGQVPEAIRDTFLFTRGFDRWRCRLPNGHYLVTVCIGDSGHEQVAQRVTVQR
jgi:FAD dependent oxidoreductase